ncbi:Mitochondrial GTPase 1, partial [Aphis craccivora]
MIFEHGLHCSIMFWLNLSILLATDAQLWAASDACQRWPRSTTIRCRTSAEDRSAIRFEAPPTEGGPVHRCRPAASLTTKATVPRRSRLSAERHRQKDIGGADTPEQVTSYDYIDSGSPNTGKSTTTNFTVAARILFGTEEECVSANKGRPCACFMTDFLDLIVQRLDETVDNEDETAATGALNCHSVKSVPTAFLVYPATAVDGLSGTTAATAAAAPVSASTPRRRPQMCRPLHRGNK